MPATRRALLGTALVLPLPALAQPRRFPDRPIRFLQGFAAGGTTDIVARLIAPPLGTELGQPVVVENRAGAGGTLAAEQLARAPKDGQTWMLINNGFAVSAALYRRLPYDPIADVDPVAMVASVGLVLLASAGGPDPIGGFAELVRRARANPDRLNVATVGVGSTQHLVAEAVQAAADIRLTHVPYRGTPAALIGLRNAEVQVVVEPVSSVLGQIRDREAVPIAITTRERSPLLPEVPTVAERLGQRDFDIATWYAIALPVGVPAEIVARVEEVTKQVTGSAEMRARLAELGLAPRPMGAPAEVKAMVRAEIARWSGLIERARIERQ
jgi:tripartite-type tricarboxylate transporter receptor subunit TctC